MDDGSEHEGDEHGPEGWDDDQLVERAVLSETPEGRAIARPSLFVIDPRGTVRFAHVGEFPRDRPSMDLVLLALEVLDDA